MIARSITADIKAKLNKGKALIILGPRQSGKTTILNELAKSSARTLMLNCDEADARAALSIQSIPTLRALTATYDQVLIDEAQRVMDIGITLKLMVDNIPGLRIIATGSSSFELSSRLNEPLTGRKYEYHLLPFSFQELSEHRGLWDERRDLSRRLIFGSYPDVVNHPGEEAGILALLTGSYLYKDVFTFQDLRKPELLDKLLLALALQIGSEVSYTELAQLTQSDHTTIQRYIHLLESAFIIFRLPNYSTNQRKEIKRARKIYFWDNGVRNALINDFRDIELRDDIGKLWENYIVAERKKMLSNHQISRHSFFWRNANNREIDYIELFDGKLAAHEIKWNPKRKIAPGSFLQIYPHATVDKIDRENYTSFLTTSDTLRS
ncbi:MAG: ATP-binding protein [Candidatus Cloacimonadaceae bacterium]|nr:ATP-binding protein [Candidatus Cloacimonadaceae bacterium]